MKLPILSLFKKPVSTVSDEITSKFKTPLITTYIIVWIIKNNLFFYDLFFNRFAPDKTLILRNNLNLESWAFYKNLLVTFLITISVLIIFYVFLNISRMITVFSEERVKLNILKKLKSKSITSVDDVTFWRDKADDFNQKNKELQEEVNTLRSTNSFYESRIKEEQKKVNDLTKNSDEAINRIKDKITEFSSNIKTTESNSVVKDLVKSVESEINRYENKKKGPSFLSLS